MRSTRIVIAGAGSVGCLVGGMLAATGAPITLLGRARIIDEITLHGLTVTDYTGLSRYVSASDLTLSDSATCLHEADLVLVTVKTGATGDMARMIAKYTPASVPVISLQNGLDAIEVLRRELPGRDVRAGMVPFNVVPQGSGCYHRSSSGEIVIAKGPGDWGARLSTPDLPILESEDIAALQWGKMLLNLNNALNALSGLALQAQLGDWRWRRLMADQMAEALSVLRAAGIAVKSTTPIAAGLMPHLLRLPTPIFRKVAARMLTIDPKARTSMAYDLSLGRVTEIDALQGRIIRLGKAHGIKTPINARVLQAIKSAEGAARSESDPALSCDPSDLRRPA